MKLQIIKGTNGCQEIDINIEEVYGTTADRELRILFAKGNKYRLTKKSHKTLIEELQKQKWLNKCFIY